MNNEQLQEIADSKASSEFESEEISSSEKVSAKQSVSKKSVRSIKSNSDPVFGP